jgi:transcriptional regulator with XRE-family HTH domain
MTKKTELREFLRVRRARLRPEDVGIPATGQRRVPGLRREEIASLAGMSVDYYVRLEQGRDLTPSRSVLDALARALRLDDVEREHLYSLVRPAVPPTVAAGSAATGPAPIRPGVRLLLDGIPTPAFVIGRRLDILATNRIARAMLADFDARPIRNRNHARWIFLDPATRDLYVDWPVVARENVAILRRDAGRYPHDTELQALIGELAVASLEFRTWWAEHDVLARSYGTKRYNHPVVGPLTVHYEASALGDEDQTLYVYSVEPGTPSADAMAILGSRAATDDRGTSGAGSGSAPPSWPIRYAMNTMISGGEAPTALNATSRTRLSNSQ